MSGRRRLVGLVGAAGAFLAVGTAPLTTAPNADADIDDLFQPIVDAIGQTTGEATFDPGLDADSAGAPALAATDSVDPTDLLAASDPFASLDGLLTDWYQTLVYDPIEQLAQSWISSPLGQAVDSWLFDDTGADTTPGAVAETSSEPETAAVPLQINATTEPVVDISVSGGWDVPVVFDTGSNGLVIPWYDLGLQDLGFPTGLGIGQYSGGLDYVYLTLPATVDFGNGIMTSQTPVDAVLFTFPTDLQNLFHPGYLTLPNFLGPADAQGVLGIGPNSVGPLDPGTPVVTAALPGELSQGVLIDEANKELVFGPNPLSDGAVSVDGAPYSPVWVSIDDGPLHKVSAIIDSGGVYGTIPSSVAGLPAGDTLPANTPVSVYADSAGHTLLYSYETGPQGQAVISGDQMNTGYYPFRDQPIYISTSENGATIFGDPH
jgi:hypothetical protein